MYTKRFLQHCWFFLTNSLCIISDFVSFNLKNNAYFLSSGRSGTNMLLACMSMIVRRPIAAGSGRRHQNNNDRLSIVYDSMKPFIRREHYPMNLWFVRKKKNRLVFLTRSHKELFLSIFKTRSEKMLNSIFGKIFIRYYVNNFRYYEKWPEDRRYMVFYDDVIEDLENNILNIFEFIDKAPTYMNDFVLKKQEILEEIRQSYVVDQKGYGGSSKGGAKKHYHTEGKDLSFLKEMDEAFRRADPYIFDKYLKRFES